MSLTFAAGLVAICLVTEGFFSGSEIAVVSADRLKLRSAAESGSRGAGIALRMLERPEHLLGTCLMGTNLSTVSASTVSAAAMVTVWPNAGSVAVVALLFPLILLFGELIPKSLFQHYADRVAPVIALPLYLFSLVFAPVLFIIEGLTRLLFKVTGGEGALHRAASREDIILLLEASEQLAIDEDDRELIQRVFEFGETRVEEAMVPLIEVASISNELTAREAVALLVEEGHSRMPVYEDRVDNVIGIVHHTDLLFLESLDIPVDRVMRPPVFVPESKHIESLFHEFQTNRTRIAVPVDEYGGAVGLITMEDILEEIVGDIVDEHDERMSQITKVGEREWLVSARVEVDVLCEETGIHLPDGDYETLAGFLLGRLGRVPGVGTRVREGQWHLEVTEASDRAVLRVRLQRR
ncbi:MAG: HlyC/CorC family transporter [Proteobacteria bacterium]|nr:HlyC/CorC family transporter [Pseudomonadota bacterium]MCP4917721.1 HlyC/CorC family transporter [Pseudomonadota bacterium]